jgi:hypothetical protein
MKVRCPSCAAEFSIEAALADESGRELLRMLPRLDQVAGPLVAYITLFRSRSRALPWDRALRLARESLAIESDPARLAAALVATVESIRAKREGVAEWKPLGNHNYLKRVLEGIPAGGNLPVAVAPAQASTRNGKRSATLDAVAALQGAINE